MKKLLAISASAVLALGMFAIGACNDNNNDDDANNDNSGVVSGNYQEPTADELTAAIESIDEEKVFENLSGIELVAGLDFSYKTNGSSISANGDIGYKLNVSETALKGMGTANVEYATTTGTKTESAKFGATVYNDSEYLYAELTGLTGTTEDDALKAKVSYSSIMGIIGDLPFYALAADEEITPDESINAEDIFEMLEEYKATVGLDTEDGLKIKISFTEESFWLFAEEGGAATEDIVMLKEAMTFNTFVFDAYFALDSDGNFSQVSLNVDIDAKADAGTNGTLEFSIKASVALKAYSGTVTLPSTLATDESYIDMSEMLEDMIGGGSYPEMPY